MLLLLLLLIFLLGILSMGLQLVGSRVLAPFFGSSIFVWASLITTFLAAFTTGAFVGATVSSRPWQKQRWVVLTLMIVCSISLLVNAVGSYAICDWIDLQVENFALKLILTSLTLYFAPVSIMSALIPLCVAYYDQNRHAAGRSAGIVTGVSTLGNIAGVLLAAFLLIPNFGVRHLLQSWWVASVIIQGGLWLIVYSRSWGSSSLAELPTEPK